MRQRIFLGLLAALAIGCGDPTDEVAPPPKDEVPRRAVRDVLDARLLELGVTARGDDATARELRDDVGLLPGEDAAVAIAPPAPTVEAGTPLDPELVEMRDGLVGMAVRDPRQLPLATKDIENLAAEMVPVLVAGLRDPGRSADELRVLAGFGAAAPHADVARALVDLAGSHDDPVVRRYAAWSIAASAASPSADAVVPGLLRRLKYERDKEALVWIATTLAAYGNFSGLPALFDLTNGPAGETLTELARTQLYQIVGDASDAEGATSEDAVALRAAWDAGEVGRASGASDPLRAELWLLVADLSGEHFQLRGVDDARHTLSRLGPWAGEELALALEDDDPYVRLHVAQSLERMGRRGRGARGGLTAALCDPSDAVAGAAAEALVAVAPEAALEPLLARLDRSPPHELRVALVRSIGRAPSTPVERLVAEFEAAAAITDLRLAAAEGLVRASREDDVLPWLADAMTDRFGDPAGAEALVQSWLRGSPGDDPRRVELRDAWFALAPPAAVIHTGDEARERRNGRAKLLRQYVAG